MFIYGTKKYYEFEVKKSLITINSIINKLSIDAIQMDLEEVCAACKVFISAYEDLISNEQKLTEFGEQ